MKFLKKLLPVLGLALFAYIIWSAGPEKIFSSLKNLNPFFLAAAFLFLIPSILLKVYKWQQIIRTQGLDISFSESCSIWLIGLFAATVTPGRLGDFAKAFYLKDKISFGKAFSTVFVERVIDLAVIFSLGAFGTVLALFLFRNNFSFTPVLLLLIAAGVILLYLLTKRKFVRIFARPVFDHMLPEKYKEKFKVGFEETFSGMRKIKDDKKKVALFFLLSYASWLFIFIFCFFVLKSMGLDIDFIYLLAFIPLSVIVELIPVTVSGFGTREAAFVFFFSLISVPANSAVLFSLLYVLSGWIFGIFGFLFWLKRPMKF